MHPVLEEMSQEERSAWLRRVSAAVEHKSFLTKASSKRSFQSHDISETAPKEYICPISLELMKDPVLLVESGQVYDRSSIEGWFKSGKSTCPVSGKKVKNMRLSPIFPLRSAIQSYADAQNIELQQTESSSSETEESPTADAEFAGNIFDGVSVYDVRGLWQLANSESPEQQASALQLLADMARFGDPSQRKRVDKIVKLEKVVNIFKTEHGALKIQAVRLLLHLPGRYFDLAGQIELLKLNSILLREEILLKFWSYSYRHRARMLEIANLLHRTNTVEIISICRKIADPTDNTEVSEETRVCASFLLAIGAFHRSVRNVLIEQEVVPFLVHFLNGSSNVGFRFCLMKAIQYIAENPEGRDQVQRAGGVRIFVMNLPPRNNSIQYSTRIFVDWFSWVTVAETAVKALYFLSFSQQGRHDMRTTATIKALRLMFNNSHFSDHAKARYLTPLLSRLASPATA